MHLFVLESETFRDGLHSRLSDESSGNTQHLLLLEEFYRTGLLLAGRPPLWWLVPPEHLHDYRAWCDQLIGKRLIRRDDWLDFGGLARIGPGEFFSAAHWQLFKGIQAPYKSLLKLLLFETYLEDFPDIRWLAEEAQARYHADDPPDAEDVDPYLLMMRRIEAHLAAAGQDERLALARRAFYLKCDVRLSRPGQHWKRDILRRLTEEWGWGQGELINLDSHREWKLPTVLEERNRLVGELSHSYRLLTSLARSQHATEQIDMQELALLGRKLFAALERRPGKIDRINPGISDDLREARIWLRHDAAQDTWQAYLAPPEEGAAPARSARGVVELFTWLIANGVIGRGTHLVLPPGLDPEQRHRRLLRLLQRRFPPGRNGDAPLGNFHRPARGVRSLILVNVRLESEAPVDRLVVSQRADPLSFGAARVNLIETLDHVYANSWGELYVDHHRGEEGVLDLLCSCLELFPDSDNEPDCHCDTPGHGALIARRLAGLIRDLREHFRRHGEQARYLLPIGEVFHVIERRRRQYCHHPVGDFADLHDYLAEADEVFRPTALDEASLRDSPLPLLLRLNRPGQVQIAYQVESSGIRMYFMDAGGAVLEHWLPEASEHHFLIQQQRFFESLLDWQAVAGSEREAQGLVFLRIRQGNGDWQVQRSRPVRPGADRCTELILGTGRRGPWRDGFSLLSEGREFSSVALGERLWSEVAAYLLSLRREGKRHPFYLTGILPGDTLPLIDLVRFKLHVERRLYQAVNE
ncbi:class I adenylate cyclase [endosymbiont of unidentified scaly snail isolate Monju]|uniref:class I adenylate cyclase n=1 Tax=endosymbiont of unidentified scaly snail isolate Monju TaxID=1248727 RepID=UPI0005BBC55E